MKMNHARDFGKTKPNKANPPKVYLPVAGGQVSDDRNKKLKGDN